MSKANVPKFGNWDDEDNVPYTVYFDKARKNKGGKMINPNDPQENPDMFPDADPSPVDTAPPMKPRPRPEETNGRAAVEPTPERRASKEESGNEVNYGGRVQRPARSSRPSGGSEQSIERSPLHPHYQARVTGRASGSPSWEGKNHDSSHAPHGTPGRSRLKPASRGDESPDKAAAVPRFGEWDENDPQSAENFTHIFNQVREERNTGPGNMSGTPKHPSYGTNGQRANQPKKCCFGWF
ncbi:hypothetical protein ACS0TY_026783 [Phlomoides rotata]